MGHSAAIFLIHNYFRKNIWTFCSLQFHFQLISGDELKTVFCSSKSYQGISCNSRRLRKRCTQNLKEDQLNVAQIFSDNIAYRNIWPIFAPSKMSAQYFFTFNNFSSLIIPCLTHSARTIHPLLAIWVWHSCTIVVQLYNCCTVAQLYKV